MRTTIGLQETAIGPASAEAAPAGSRAPAGLPDEEGPRAWEDCCDPGGGDLFAKAHAFQSLIAREEAAGNHFFRRAVAGANRAHARIRDPRTGRLREVIMLGSNSYLGLNADPRVVAAALEATRRYGYGSGSVSLYAGTTDLHLEVVTALLDAGVIVDREQIGLLLAETAGSEVDGAIAELLTRRARSSPRP